MANLFRYLGQAIVLAVIAVAVGYLSNGPAWVHFPSDKAQIKLSFAHGAKRKVACKRFTAKEIAKLKRHERRPHNCSRERLPVAVELLLDDRLLFSDILQPSGIARDGPARTYRKFEVDPGNRKITVRLRDSGRATGFDYEKTVNLSLAPLQNLAIDFQADRGGFYFR